jgi:hypothetical protein
MIQQCAGAAFGSPPAQAAAPGGAPAPPATEDGFDLESAETLRLFKPECCMGRREISRGLLRIVVTPARRTARHIV